MNQPLPNKSLPMPSLRNIQAFIEVADTGSLKPGSGESQYYSFRSQSSDSQPGTVSGKENIFPQQ
ncbi:transcriptional regulator [Klebsiella grimontii]|uniref:Transcriptional regulator n=1 Tax=Klebsiella grimontii TaxID=2058152 RepID=A0A7H4P7E3_9ENTR|nr:transcriptional regulator [Klebsiella grimontii]